MRFQLKVELEHIPTTWSIAQELMGNNSGFCWTGFERNDPGNWSGKGWKRSGNLAANRPAPGVMDDPARYCRLEVPPFPDGAREAGLATALPPVRSGRRLVLAQSARD